MKPQTNHIASIVAAIFVMAASPPAFAEDKAPAFLEVGKVYSTVYTIVEVKFKVLDLGKDAWIKAELVEVGEDAEGTVDKGDVVWINTKALTFITPVEADKAKSKKKKKE